MKMYIANCTQQVQDFIYSIPETRGPRKQSIPIGGQIAISGDLGQNDVDAIVEQHGPYGLVSVDEVDRTKPFIGVCYAIGKPVPVEKIRRALAHNVEVLTDRGRELRKEAAVAANNSIEEANPGLKALDMTVVEDTKGKDREVDETVRVTRSAEPESRRPARAARGR